MATTRNLHKKVMKTHVTTKILDKNFSKDTWTVHPSIIPFLSNIMFNCKNHLHPYVVPVNSLSAKSVLVGEKLVAMYSIST
jgi:hypothetical protein